VRRERARARSMGGSWRNVGGVLMGESLYVYRRCQTKTWKRTRACRNYRREPFPVYSLRVRAQSIAANSNGDARKKRGEASKMIIAPFFASAQRRRDVRRSARSRNGSRLNFHVLLLLLLLLLLSLLVRGDNVLNYGYRRLVTWHENDISAP